MLFDQVRELPVATVRRAPHSRLVLAAGDLQRWLIAQWVWFRPRSVPTVVALIGMLAMLHAVNYLSHPPAAKLAARAALDSGSPSTMVFVDAKPTKNGAPMHSKGTGSPDSSLAPDLEGTRYRVHLVVQY